jgi:hypothetical protein
MSVNTIDSGQNEKTFDRLSLADGLGTFTSDADASTTVTDTAVKSTSRIIVFPTNAAAGLLLRSASCFVTPGTGSFTFNVSATGAGAPAGTETFAYVSINDVA